MIMSNPKEESDGIRDVNILLLGERGVGKSAFINTFYNHFLFDYFESAMKATKSSILIPPSATQEVKKYSFLFEEGRIRFNLIDTPGILDKRGVNQDDQNCENILSFLSQLKELHGICFLIKPASTTLATVLEYCVKQLLSCLEKSAANNIIFIFVNTRGIDYTPGESSFVLKKIIDDINFRQGINIPFRYESDSTSNNVYCVDNEALQYVTEMKHNNLIDLEATVKPSVLQSWEHWSEEFAKLFSYILGDKDLAQQPLQPHQLVNTICINEARRIIWQLSKPLADIEQLIQDNILLLDRHRENLNTENESINEMKNKLFIPAVDLKVTELKLPVTVCGSAKCTQLYNVGKAQKQHYPQRCHDPCGLKGVEKDVIGTPELLKCWAIEGSTGYCKVCSCRYSVHMHIYYMTETIQKNIEDCVVKVNIETKQEAIEQTKKLIQQIIQRRQELEDERSIIVRSLAQFALFLKKNAITAYNDAYEKYINYLIDREKNLGTQAADMRKLRELEKLADQYNEVKRTFELSLQQGNKLKDCGVDISLNAQSIRATMQQLYGLKHNGPKIRELFESQNNVRKTEYDCKCEYIRRESSTVS